MELSSIIPVTYTSFLVCQFLINSSVDEIDHDDEVCIDPLKR